MSAQVTREEVDRLVRDYADARVSRLMSDASAYRILDALGDLLTRLFAERDEAIVALRAICFDALGVSADTRQSMVHDDFINRGREVLAKIGAAK